MTTIAERDVTWRRWRSMLLLIGSFAFAFLLGEAVHEAGHYLAHRAYGNTDIRIHIDPFGGSRIVGVTSLPLHVTGLTSAAGPLLNLVMGIACVLLLWRGRNPMTFPLLLWGPVAMVQEGVTFSLGFLTPGGDAQWIVAWGMPTYALLMVGIALLLAGIIVMGRLLPLVGLRPHESLGPRFLVLTMGVSSLMFLRAMHSLLVSAASAIENLVPLLFSLLLTTVVVALQKPVASVLDKGLMPRLHPVTWPATAWALALGASVLVLQWLAG